MFDLAASGHSLSMLKLPWVIVDTVPQGPLTVDARSIRELLLDRRRTSLVLVTLAEEMPVNEARDLATGLQTQLGIEVARLIINQVSPDRFPSRSPQRGVLDALERAASIPPDLAAAAAHARLAAARRELNEHYIAEARKAIPAPHSELPQLFVPTLGPAEIDALTEIADRELGPNPRVGPA